MAVGAVVGGGAVQCIRQAGAMDHLRPGQGCTVKGWHLPQLRCTLQDGKA